MNLRVANKICKIVRQQQIELQLPYRHRYGTITAAHLTAGVLDMRPVYSIYEPDFWTPELMRELERIRQGPIFPIPNLCNTEDPPHAQ